MTNRFIPLTAAVLLLSIFPDSGAWAQASMEPTSATETAQGAVEPKVSKWEKSIQAFEAGDKIQPPKKDGVVFVGSSSIRKWTKLTDDFSEIPATNRGFGGSQVKDSVEFAGRIVIPYQPRVVVLYAGGNDLNAKMTPAQVMEQYRAFDKKVLAALPSTTIVHISLNPTIARAAQDAEVKETNRLLAEYCQADPRLVFIESYSKLAGPDGLARAEWMEKDGIHLNAEGYRQWKSIIKPVILETYQKSPPIGDVTK